MDAYHWTVLYRDGTVHQQIVNGEDIGDWSSVDHGNIDRIILFPHDESLPVHGVRVPIGKEGFLTFQRNIALDLNTGIQSHTPVSLIVGWEGCYLFIDPFGNVSMVDDASGGP